MSFEHQLNHWLTFLEVFCAAVSIIDLQYLVYSITLATPLCDAVKKLFLILTTAVYLHENLQKMIILGLYNMAKIHVKMYFLISVNDIIPISI